MAQESKGKKAETKPTKKIKVASIAGVLGSWIKRYEREAKRRIRLAGKTA